MRTRSKALLLSLCAVLLVAASVLGTMAYLTDTDTVTNTFTVGAVAITLDETDVDEYGVKESKERVSANSYKLIPGHTYIKDPMVTVKKDSEKSYIKMTLTVSKSAELDAIFNKQPADLLKIFGGYDATNWLYKGNAEDNQSNTRTYTFWYKETVAAPEQDIKLDALFDTITVPGEISKVQLETIKDMTITVKAFAIQADTFNSADEAWTAFDTQKNT